MAEDFKFCPKCGAGINMQDVSVPNHLVLAILTTLFCCIPFGIVSLVYASRVDLLLSCNRVDDAKIASAKARNWAFVGIVSMLILMALYSIIVMFSGVCALNNC